MAAARWSSYNGNVRSNPTLKRLYRKLNKRWFGGRLPKDTIIVWSDILGTGAARCSEEGGQYIIRLNTNYRSSRVVGLSLLHEMAHIATFDEKAEHGPRWLAEMHRLSNAGAFEDYW